MRKLCYTYFIHKCLLLQTRGSVGEGGPVPCPPGLQKIGRRRTSWHRQGEHHISQYLLDPIP